MARLPLIVGFGGVNAAGRSSFHHGYRRMVISALSDSVADETYSSLASLMNLPTEERNGLTAGVREHIGANTLIRKIDHSLFDSARMPWNRRVHLRPEPAQPICFDLRKKHLPEQIPEEWELHPIDERTVQVVMRQPCEMLLPDTRASDVNAAGQLPTGFDPKRLYQSRNHPRGLQMTVFGASDAIHSSGLDWETIRAAVAADQISVYAGSAMSQLDQFGNGGMMRSRMNGKRVTSKQCALGFAEMPADFINAYILGSIGTTGTNMGACASFLYNLRQGVMDIQTGKSRVVLVGNSEAPITPEVMEGYAAMGALATDKELLALDNDKNLQAPDYQRACRPFGENCGFTLAESAQFILLFDDDLALQLGATIYGAVDDVFINADGHKKSISAPGVGNYITIGKALASAQQIVGEEGIRSRSFVQAHGTGTPQNRVTESHVLNEAAKAFGIDAWPVAAVKNYLGHSIGVAGGDQLVASLGVWAYGYLPGITSIDRVAEDVHSSNLTISAQHRQLGGDAIDLAILNAKGFGGNNASASLLAPHIAQRMISKKHGTRAWQEYQQKNVSVQQQAHDYDQAAIAGEVAPIYKFDHNVLHGEDMEFAAGGIKLKGHADAISLQRPSPYADMLD
ncbi:MAG: beta-ketoacyl synthase [Pseudomonadales bacterium]